jgi:hypothetical protein
VARGCNVCRLPPETLQQVNRRLLEGTASNAAIARDHALSDDSVSRHRARHLPSALVKAREVEIVAQADDLLETLQALDRKTGELLDKAEAAGDLKTAVAAAREARGHLELKAKLLGRLEAGRHTTQVNVNITQQYVTVKAVMVAALAPYPEARGAVVEALARLEATNEPA